MFEIINKQILADGIKRIDITAPAIANKFKPGQFISICPEEGDEKIPLTIVDSDKKKGSISLIFQEKGDTTGKLGVLPINESIFSVLGPLGVATDIKKYGTVLFVATDIGAAQILPICRALGKAGNKIIGIMGARTKRKIMLEPQMRIACDKLFITTEDGSYEKKGVVTDVLEGLIKSQKINMVYAIGSVSMMHAVSLLTKKKGIKTLVQLKPVMVDCMGMCGSCRVKVDGEMISACVHGPEFDGHKVDFEDFNTRIKSSEELDEWHSQKLHAKRHTKESGTLMKFLSDILRR